MTSVWDLEARPTLLNSAAEAWVSVARACADSAAGFTGAANRALGSWTGASADAFSGRRSQLLNALDQAQQSAIAISEVIFEAASAVVDAQRNLDASKERVSAAVLSDTVPLSLNPVDTAIVEAELSYAAEVRAQLDSKLAALTQALSGNAATWAKLATDWQLSDGAFIPLPAEGEHAGIIVDGSNVYLTTGSGDDHVEIETDPTTGDLIVIISDKKSSHYLDEKGNQTSETVRTERERFRIPAGSNLTVRGGSGDDTIVLPAGTTAGFTVVGGAGVDRITGSRGADRLLGGAGSDEITGGESADYISGGADADYLDGQSGDDLLFGGQGRDTIYGLSGHDQLSGEGDVDYLEGGTGSDTLAGGAGNDVLSSGRGDDRILAGSGSDVNYGGKGRDQTWGGAGADTSYDDDLAGVAVENQVSVEGADLSSWIDIEGSPEFVERVQADLDLLNASPAGRQMLGKLAMEHAASTLTPGGNDESLTITEWTHENENEQNSTASQDDEGNLGVRYSPEVGTATGKPPIVTFQHELAHIEDYMTGNMDNDPYQGEDEVDAEEGVGGIRVPNAERQAVGLPYDHDNDPSTPERIDPNHPIQRTENGLRSEMGLPPREHYREPDSG